MTSEEMLIQTLKQLESDGNETEGEASTPLLSRYQKGWRELESLDSTTPAPPLPPSLHDRTQRLDVTDKILARAVSGGTVAVMLSVGLAVGTALGAEPWGKSFSHVLATLLFMIPALAWLLPACMASKRWKRNDFLTLATWVIFAPPFAGAIANCLSRLPEIALGAARDNDLYLYELAQSTVQVAFDPLHFLVGAVLVVVALVVERRLSTRYPWVVAHRSSRLSQVFAGLLVAAGIFGYFALNAHSRSRIASVDWNEVNSLAASATQSSAWRNVSYDRLTRTDATASLLELLLERERRPQDDAVDFLRRLQPHLKKWSGGGLPPDVLVALAAQVDAELGFFHRSYNHPTKLESQILPYQLGLWRQIRDITPSGRLWSVRNSGTLFAVRNVLQSPQTSASTVNSLLSQLDQLRLTRGELDTHLKLQVLKRYGMRTFEATLDQRPSLVYRWRDDPVLLAIQARAADQLRDVALQSPTAQEKSTPLILSTIVGDSEVEAADIVMLDREEAAALPVSLNLLRAAALRRSGSTEDTGDPSLVWQGQELTYPVTFERASPTPRSVVLPASVR